MKKLMKKLLKTNYILYFIILLLSLGLMYLYFSNYHIIYMFNGSNEEITITDGVIFKSNKVNLMSGSNIKFNNNKLSVKNYKAGYYINKDTKLEPILVIKGELEDEMLLKDILEDEGIFNINNNNEIESTKDLLNKEIVFLVEATTNEDEDYTSLVEISITNLSH